MGNTHPVERRRGGPRTPIMNVITLMMTKSMAFFLAALLVQRIWTLLNTDVTHVFRRL
jgi:hypothetical protein